MNSFAIVFVLCFASALEAALSPDQLSILNQYKEACIVESGVDRAVVDNLRNGEFAENDEKLGSFSACMLKKIGVVALVSEDAKVIRYEEECIVESGVDRAAVDNFRKGVIRDNDEKFSCYTACMQKKTGVMNADGSLNEAVARSLVPAYLSKEKTDEFVNTVKALHSGSNVCEAGVKITKYTIHFAYSEIVFPSLSGRLNA